MAKFYGDIGYGITEEVRPGVWQPTLIKRKYSGDVIRNTRRWSEGQETTNDNLSISNEISIVADAFAYQHFHTMRWIEWMGVKWKITSVQVDRPRLRLTIGGEYNGPEIDVT